MDSYIAGIFILLFSGFAGGQTISQKVYLLPEGLVGDVYIFHGVPRGEKIESVGATTTFRIPESRYLVTSLAPDFSLYQDFFFYLNEKGEKTRIEVERSSLHKTKENLADDRPFIWNPGRSVASWWTKVQCEVRYEQFYVGTRLKMLRSVQNDRDEEYSRLQAFVEANQELICEGKPKRQNTIIKKTEN